MQCLSLPITSEKQIGSCWALTARGHKSIIRAAFTIFASYEQCCSVSSDALLHSLLQRDVPGMTRNAIPILVDEGVQAITIGVNGGSAPPGVPKNMPFIWRDKPSGKEIITAVHPGRLIA